MDDRDEDVNEINNRNEYNESSYKEEDLDKLKKQEELIK